MKNKEEIKFWTIVVLTIGGGLLSLRHYSATQNEFWRALGDALIIAGVIAGTVDQYAKNRILKEMMRNVYQHLIGHDLPVEVKDRIKELMSTDLIRRDWELKLRLATSAANPRYVSVHAELAYCVVNLTGSAIEYEHYFEHDRSPNMLEIRCDTSDESARYRSVEKDLQILELGGGRKGARGRKVWIKPHNENLGVEYRFRVVWEFLEPEEGSEDLVHTYPTIGATLRVEGTPGFAFKPSTPDYTSGNDLDWWHYNRLFLREESLGLDWWPLPSEQTERHMQRDPAP